MQKTYVVTGGSSGIGAATVERLMARGHLVYSLDITSTGDVSGHYIPCDLSAPVTIDEALAHLPVHVDGLVSAAGVAPGGTSPERVIAINFLGMRLLTMKLLPRIVDEGSVVTVASSAGRDWSMAAALVNQMLATPDFESGMAWVAAHFATIGADPYKFSKQCAAAWTYSAAGLARSRRVRVNCVNPGIVQTRLSAQFRDMLGNDRYDWIVEQSGRAGEPQEVADVIEFLAAGESRWLNGVEITVDGGYYAGLVGGWIDPNDMPTGT